MKSIMSYSKLIFAVLVLTMVQLTTFAQETSGGGSSTSTTKVEITADTGNWFSDNWLWVAGVVVFIILLFALMGSGGRSRRTTVVREDLDTGRVSRTTTVDDDL